VVDAPEEPGGPNGQPGQQRHDGEPTEAVEDEDPEPAFGMLDTVREYAREQLAAAGEPTAARRAHAHYFLALAERAEPLLDGPDQRAWYLRLEREHDNPRAALRWLLDRDDQDGPDAAAEREAGLRLAGVLGWFWWRRGYSAEGGRWLAEALARAPEADLAVRTRALVSAGPDLMLQGDVTHSQTVLEEGLALAERRSAAPPTSRVAARLILAQTAAWRHCERGRTRCWMQPTPLACATWMRPASTVAPRSSSGHGCRHAASCPER
jgi:hypothetical protein